MKLIGVMAVVLALGTPAAVGANTAGRSGRTGVLHGVVSKSPACSKPQPCVPVPNAKIVFLRHGHPVAHTTSSDFGSYRIRLTAGRYGIRVWGYDGAQPVHVRVRRAQVKRVDITVGQPTA